MKQFVFKQAALLGKGKAGLNSMGKIYHVGVHGVSEEHQKDPTFVAYLKGGLIVPHVVKEQGELAPASSDAAKQSAEVAASQLNPDAEIGGGDEASEEAAEEVESEKSHGHRKGKRK